MNRNTKKTHRMNHDQSKLLFATSPLLFFSPKFVKWAEHPKVSAQDRQVRPWVQPVWDNHGMGNDGMTADNDI